MMKMYSDEEAIENVKFIIGDLEASNYNKTFIKSIETLLTAYEKEKEKNKEAREYIYDALNNDDIINVGIDDMKIILDMLEE